MGIGFGGFGGFGTGMGMFGVLFFLVFFVILAVIVINLVKGIGSWNRNNHAPRLSVTAEVTAKRMEVSHHNRVAGTDQYGHVTHSRYYVTFQVESGDRMELSVTGYEYGMLAEGDMGRLSFQGSRFLGFERFQ